MRRRFDPEFVRQELAITANKKGAYLEQVCVERQALDYIEFLEDVVEGLRAFVSTMDTAQGAGTGGDPSTSNPSREEERGSDQNRPERNESSPVVCIQNGYVYTEDGWVYCPHCGEWYPPHSLHAEFPRDSMH
jgi:hypothetical protein